MLDKFVHSINIAGTLHLMSRNVDFRTFILQLCYHKNNFQPQKFSLDFFQYTNLLVQITLSMVFIKHNSLKSDIFLNPIFMPCFSGSMFFSAQVFQGLGPGSGSRFQKQPHNFCFTQAVDLKFNQILDTPDIKVSTVFNLKVCMVVNKNLFKNSVRKTSISTFFIIFYFFTFFPLSCEPCNKALYKLGSAETGFLIPKICENKKLRNENIKQNRLEL